MTTTLRGILRNSIALLAMQSGSVLLGFVTSIVIARLLGPSGFGEIAYIRAWVIVLALVSTLGFNQLLVREVTACNVHKDWRRMKDMLRSADRWVLLVSLTIMSLAALAVWLVGGSDESSQFVPFALGLLALPFISLSQVRLATMRGLLLVIRAFLPDLLIRPILFLLLILAFHLFFPASLSTAMVLFLQLIVLAVCFLVASILCSRALPGEIGSAGPPDAHETWIYRAFPFLFIGAIEAIHLQADIIMVGAIAGQESAGLYAAASRLALPAIFVLGSVNLAVAPIIARAYRRDDRAGLQYVISRSSHLIFLATLGICAVVFVLGGVFLAWFGAEFVKAQLALNFLLAGRIAIACAGSVVVILKMSGHEWEVLWTGAISLAVNMMLNALLIPAYGIEGAAVATAVGGALWPILATVVVRRRLGLNPTIFQLSPRTSPQELG